jgi:hypothetical protein
MPYRQGRVALDATSEFRTSHRHAELPRLWRGQNGQLTDWGLVMILRRRGDQVGLPAYTRTKFRHAFPNNGSPQDGGVPSSCLWLAGSPA